jgi:hypothetical protein
MKHVSKSALIDATLVCLVIGSGLAALVLTPQRQSPAENNSAANPPVLTRK